MNVWHGGWVGLTLAAGTMLAPPAGAAEVELGAFATPEPVAVNTLITNVLWITNRASFALTDIYVTNSFSPGLSFVRLVYETNLPAPQVSSNASSVLVLLSGLDAGQDTFLRLELQSSVPGLVTNRITVAPSNAVPATTSIVSTVVRSFSDLALRVGVPAAGVFVDDWTTYTLTVTNAGPDAALGVVLSHPLPAAAILRGVGPAGSTFTRLDDTLRFSLGTLNATSSALVQVTVQPTSAGAYAVQASVSAPDVQDDAPTNNTATGQFTASAPALEQVATAFVSAQTYQPQTGLTEQRIRVANLTAAAMESVRVLVAGLNHRLFNAIGTNGESPFVVYSGRLEPGGSIELLLEYFIPARLPVANPTLTAYAVPRPDLAAPGGELPNISTVTTLGPGRVLIEFESVVGRTYAILYSDTVGFTNAFMAQPSVVAPADRVQWIDDGPPKTIRPPSQRFYRVLQLQP